MRDDDRSVRGLCSQFYAKGGVFVYMSLPTARFVW